MYTLFRVISSIISVYSLLCIVRIILTWIPAYYGRAGAFLSAVCDPYMRLFRGIKWLTFGGLDFSPALGLCLLSAASSLFSALGNGGAITVPLILAMIIEIVYSIVSSLITFVIILLAVRLVLIFVNRRSYNSGSYMLEQIDRAIAPMVYRLSKPFSFGRTVTFLRALITSIIVLVVLNILLRFVIGLLVTLIIR